jgi:hypothetical protein
VSFCDQEVELHYTPYVPSHDYSKDYLTTEALENGTISFDIPIYLGLNFVSSISYSTDNGVNWVTTNNEDKSIVITVNVSEGDKILWKGEATQLCDEYPCCFFSSTCQFNVYGNIMSLLYGDEYKTQTSLSSVSYILSGLFHDFEVTKVCMVVNAENLILPATTLPEYCYLNMFNGCTSLTTAPALPATTLAEYCYSNMFSGCTSLTSAPELPATTLANSCYEYMFYGCTSLTTVPELPALTLVNSCYDYMFKGCSSLNYIKALFTTTPASSYTNNWVQGVAATGTFVKNSAAEWNVIGNYGVPSGWTVETASE